MVGLLVKKDGWIV